MNKIFPKIYNCYYCQKDVPEGKQVERNLMKNGQVVTRLIICSDCNKKVKRETN